MANAVLKKDRSVSIRTKSGKDYQYKFTTLAEIHRYLAENQLQYEAYTATENGTDYLYIQKLSADGEKLGDPLRGTKIPQAQDIKTYGGALTTCRRYSLLMAYGLACEDEDQVNSTMEPGQDPQKQFGASANHPVSEKQKVAIRNLAKKLGKESVEILSMMNAPKSAKEASLLIKKLGAEVDAQYARDVQGENS